MKCCDYLQAELSAWVSSLVLKWSLQKSSHQSAPAPRRPPPDPVLVQLLFSACAGTDVFPSSFSTSASSSGASLLHSCIKYIVGYRTPGCPIPISPTTILIGQSGGQSVSLTLTWGNSGILPGWLLSSLLVLLTSLSYPVLWLLRLHCCKPRPALVPHTSVPGTGPNRSSWHRMETPSTLMGVHWLVPSLKLSCMLGLTT